MKNNYFVPRRYGIPSAAGARTRPISPETATIVARYGIINMNSDGIGTPAIDKLLCKLLVKPKNSAAIKAPLGLHFPNIKQANAINPAPAVIDCENTPTAPIVKTAPPIPATAPAIMTFLNRNLLTSIPTLSAAIGSSPTALVLNPHLDLNSAICMTVTITYIK